MKKRIDYVTNSSSSSFVIIKYKNKELEKILSSHEDFFERDLIEYSVNDDEVEIKAEEAGITVPRRKTDVVNALCEFFAEGMCMMPDRDNYYDKESYEKALKNAREDLEGHPIAVEIFDNKKIVNAAMELIEISCAYESWGSEDGDEETRIFTYDKKTGKAKYRVE